MSAKLCSKLSDSYLEPANTKTFFSERENRDLEKLALRETISSDPRHSCDTNLFLGFFFDGTRNNYKQDEADKSQSNVARLYDIFPGLDVPGVLPPSSKWKGGADPRFPHFFRIYMPGVASPFPEVKDSGDGLTKTLGGAGGRAGEDRIVWALIQAINSVHRFFYKTPLLSPQKTTDLATRLSLTKSARWCMTQSWVGYVATPNVADFQPHVEFKALLKKLHASVSQHWPVGKKDPKKIDPGIVRTIHVSMFGFSRGATEARVFAKWLESLCQLDAMLRGHEGPTLGGFPVSFDFLGLFDTVASVGLGNTYGNALLLKFADGHGAWADAEDSMRISPSINRCVHLVAGHELRRSFPLDSVSVGTALPANCEEIVFPGVHSDVGGGYAPLQHGKGLEPNGNDMLSRLPLLYMYREARLSGTPLKLELADDRMKKKFALDARVLRDFNAYLSKCTKDSGTLTDIMREQQLMQMAWRYARRDNGPAPLHKQANFLRCSNFDKNDLESANKEFNTELAEFTNSLNRFKYPHLNNWNPQAKHQKAGFHNNVSSEWEEIAVYWPLKQPDPIVAHFFDEYVHDSRAGFKLRGSDNPAGVVRDLERWSRDLAARKAMYEHPVEAAKSHFGGVPPDYGMHTNERMAAEAYDRAKRLAPNEKDRTKLIPRYIVEGREPAFLAEAGYFRFRKIYGGSDSVLLSNWYPADREIERYYVHGDEEDAPTLMASQSPMPPTDRGSNPQQPPSLT